MSSISSTSIQTLDIGTGHSLFVPKKFDRNEQLLYCASTIVSEGRSTSAHGRPEDIYELSSKEKRLVKQRLLQHVLANKNIKPFVEVDKTRVVVKASRDSPLSLLQDQEKQSAIVLSWNGRGYPPPELHIGEDTSMAFKKIYHDKERAAQQDGLRFHWSSVNIVQDDKPDLEKLWNRLVQRTGSNEFVILHVPVLVKTTSFTLPQMLAQARGADSATARRSREVVQALYLNEYELNDVTVHGHRMFFPDESKSLLGLSHTLGQSRKLSLNANDPPMPIVQHSTTAKLFLPETTVADFLVEYYGSAHNVTLQGTADLEQMLRGKTVRFRTSSGYIDKPIAHVSSVTPNTLTNREHMHPYWRGKIAPLIRFPDLPCIDLGNGVLLPAEMCNFLPGQSYKQNITPLISHALSKIKMESELDDLTLDQTGIVLPPHQESKQERRDNLDIAISLAFEKGAVVHFGEAGISGIESVHWSAFKKSFGNTRSLKKAGGVTVQSGEESIKLSFHPTEDPTSVWRQQMESWKSANCIGKKALLVVAIRSDKYHSEIYRIIKFLADIELGIQVYFVKVETLEQKVEKNPAKGMEMAANEVVRRMALRNPAAMPITFDVVQDIAVSVHIGPVSVEVPKIGKDGQSKKSSKTIYLVVLTSRHMEKSMGHATMTKLVEGKDLTATVLCSFLFDFLEVVERNTNINKRLRHRVTVFRSGHIPTLLKTNLSPPEKFSSTRFLDDYERKDLFITKSSDLASCNEVINSEVVGFRAAVKTMYGVASAMSYILLCEDKDLKFSGSLKHSLSKASSNPDPNVRFFITDTNVNPDRYTIGAHHQANGDINASVVILTLLGDPLADPLVVKEPVSSSGSLESLLRPYSPPKMTRKDSFLSIGDQQFTDKKKNDFINTDTFKIPNPLPTTAMANPFPAEQESPSPISNSELERLAKVWVDDSLNLQQPKWPAPTHLAHLAWKRAQMYVRKTEKKVGDGQNGMGYELKAVHGDVKDTLYYL